MTQMVNKEKGYTETELVAITEATCQLVLLRQQLGKPMDPREAVGIILDIISR